MNTDLDSGGASRQVQKEQPEVKNTADYFRSAKDMGTDGNTGGGPMPAGRVDLTPAQKDDSPSTANANPHNQDN